LSTITRIDTLIVPRIVSKALRGTAGITSLTGDGDASGFSRTSDVTDFASVDLAPTDVDPADLVSMIEAAGFGRGSLFTAAAASLGEGAGAGD
jgi:hypothetical protein